MAGQVNCLEHEVYRPSGGEENPVQSAGPPEAAKQFSSTEYSSTEIDKTQVNRQTQEVVVTE
ncbi:hypothetical protein [Nocardia goodfellowii]|uniref:Uncharacterized protein n=1 Tax=Nocardia goodfellowii TaxID=882446 RepID=A0ABS4QR35_9NOCA|nr:hypothetical protein [Nocardia goodfellowii]MBP2193509.1 hypothetical protein [Nocardia goodfellowii]